MPQYSPPPADLSKLNPIQRYLQKGQLDRHDWLRLIALVLAYFIIRPYLEQGAKWLFSPKEGEAVQQAYQQRRAQAKIGANAIRGTDKKKDEVVELEELDDDTAVVTGSHVAGKADTVNRKKKSALKNEQDKLLNWDDEPARKPTDGDQADVMQWLNKWDE